jgi:cell fate (sporulation/competence/biofilm development) regulator YlbF (YheA/YmcA/DUF963 family)
MPADTKEIIDAADKLGQLVAQHPAVSKYKQAQESVAKDPDASRLLGEFDRQIETLARQEQSGMPLTDAQRQQIESLQSQIVSHIKIKALNMAQVDFIDLLRKINQTYQKYVMDQPSAGGGNGGASRGPAIRPA